MDVKIGGIIPFTLQDYPGQVAAMVFMQGCNFRCTYCHNKGLIPEYGKHMVPPSSVLAFLTKRRLRLRGVVISGGEPTCQAGLARFLSELKSLGYSIKLDTNGSNPRVLERLLGQGLVDYIAMDIKAPWDRYEDVTGIPGSGALAHRSMEIVARSGIQHIFRTTVVPGLIDESDIRAIRELVPKGSNHVLQPFKPVYRIGLG